MGPYRGKLLVDGLELYDLVAEDSAFEGMILCGCLTHCRRYFDQAAKVTELSSAQQLALKDYLGKVFFVERQIDEQRQARERAGGEWTAEETLETTVTQKLAYYSAVLRLDPGLVILPPRPRARELDPLVDAILDQRLVHELTAVIDIQRTQRKGQSLANTVKCLNDQTAFSNNQRRSLGPAAGNVGQHQAVHVTAAVGLPAMCDQVHLHASWRRLVPIREGAHPAHAGVPPASRGGPSSSVSHHHAVLAAIDRWSRRSWSGSYGASARQDAGGRYEDLYCARGEMETRIKEAQLNLFADRLSTETFRANQLRLWLYSAAYVLMHALRRLGLANTPLARACAHTIRLKLLKIGAGVRVSVRRVKLAMSQACPHQREFIAAFHALSAAAR